MWVWLASDLASRCTCRLCELIGVAKWWPSPPARERARAAADRLGVEKAYGDWREMVSSEEVDAISIATSPAIQTPIAIAALGQRKAVFCEKPLAASEQDARAMCAAAAEAGVANMVDFEFPEIEEWKRAKALIDSGGIGSLRQITVHWNVETWANRKRLDSWKTRTEDGGGTLGNFVSHVFYYLEWLAGPIADLSARLFRTPGDERTGDSFDALSMRF